MFLTTGNSLSTTPSGRSRFSVMIHPRTNVFSSTRIQMLNNKSPLMVGHGSVHAFSSDKSPLMVGHGSVHAFRSNFGKRSLRHAFGSVPMVGHSPVFALKALENEGELFEPDFYEVMSKVKAGDFVVRDASDDLEYYVAAQMKAAAIEESLDTGVKKSTNMIIADEYHNFKRNIAISQTAGEHYKLSLAVIGDEKIFSLHDSFLGLIESRISFRNPLRILGDKSEKICTISFLAVQKEFRRNKVASRMIKRQLVLARDEGAVYAFVNIPTECSGAMDMFHKMKFQVFKDISPTGMKMTVALYPLNGSVSKMI